MIKKKYRYKLHRYRYRHNVDSGDEQKNPEHMAISTESLASFEGVIKLPLVKSQGGNEICTII